MASFFNAILPEGSSSAESLSQHCATFSMFTASTRATMMPSAPFYWRYSAS